MADYGRSATLSNCAMPFVHKTHKINVHIFWYLCKRETVLRWRWCFTPSFINTVLVGRIHSITPGCTTWPWSSSGGDAVLPVSAHLQQEAGCYSATCRSILWASWCVHF